MILPADNGCSTVVMDEAEHHAKVDSLLLDQQFYKVPDPTSSTEKMNAALLGLKKNGAIPELLCKIVGGGCCMGYRRFITDVRPVKAPSMSTVTTVGKSSSFVSSSSEFISFLKSITIPEEYELVSFDVSPTSP